MRGEGESCPGEYDKYFLYNWIKNRRHFIFAIHYRDKGVLLQTKLDSTECFNRCKVSFLKNDIKSGKDLLRDEYTFLKEI